MSRTLRPIALAALAALVLTLLSGPALEARPLDLAPRESGQTQPGQRLDGASWLGLLQHLFARLWHPFGPGVGLPDPHGTRGGMDAEG